MDFGECFVSVVIPLFNSEETVAAVVREVEDEFGRIGITRYEIILVNDRSQDETLEVVTGLALTHKSITVLDLARNVGQVNALMAGYEFAKGDFIVSMDDDMQTPGNAIGEMLEALIERDDDIVFASYEETDNNRSPLRRFGTNLNWAMASVATKKPRGIETNSFFIMRKYIRDVYIGYRGKKIYPYGILFECTDRVSNYTVRHRPRGAGKSGFSLMTLTGLLLDGLMNFSLKPLRVVTLVGLVILAASLVGMAIAIVIWRFYIGLFWGFAFLCSLQLIGTGILGEYVGRVFLTESHLPRYTVRDVIAGPAASSAQDCPGTSPTG